MSVIMRCLWRALLAMLAVVSLFYQDLCPLTVAMLYSKVNIGC